MNSEDVFCGKSGRPKAILPTEEILRLRGCGCSCRGIVMRLDSKGIKTSKSSVHRLLKEIET